MIETEAVNTFQFAVRMMVLKLQSFLHILPKKVLMYKILFLLVLLSFAACKNADSNKSDNADSAKRSTGLPTDTVAKEATFSFIDGCMENAKLTLGDQKAFAFCKCIYNQLKAQNPGADSIVLNELAMDTARVARMAAACR